MNSSQKIDHFAFEYDWASNFYPITVIMDGVAYATVEHAYQAAKTTDIEKRWILTLEVNPRLSPGQAKNLGQKIELRPDWAEVKDSVMRDLVMQKFTIADVLKKKLIDTGDAFLEEGNWWHDTYWGVCHGKLEGRTCKKISLHQVIDENAEVVEGPLLHIGSNKLGLLLMDVRQTLKSLSTPATLGYNLISTTNQGDIS
jgi:ribA/ribD-fused uncharacterized protein